MTSVEKRDDTHTFKWPEGNHRCSQDKYREAYLACRQELEGTRLVLDVFSEAIGFPTVEAGGPNRHDLLFFWEDCLRTFGWGDLAALTFRYQTLASGDASGLREIPLAEARAADRITDDHKDLFDLVEQLREALKIPPMSEGGIANRTVYCLHVLIRSAG